MPAFKLLVGALLTLLALVFAILGCSAPMSPKYQKYQQVAQKKKSLPPVKQAGDETTFSKNSADDCFKLGEIYLSQGQTQVAYHHFRRAVHLNPYHQGALLYLAYFAAQSGNVDDLGIIVRRIKQRDPDNAAIHEILAVCSLRRGQFDKAERQFETALKNNADSVIAHLGLSTIFQRRGDYSRAVNELTTALEQQPNHRVLLMELADCYWQANRRSRAIRIYEKCLKLHPQSLDLRLRVARTYREARLFDRALALYQEARVIAPDNTYVLLEMARTHLAQGDNDAALTCLRDVKKLSHGLVAPEVQQLLSVAYLNQGDAVHAEAELEEGLRRMPHHTMLRLQLAIAYLTQQKYAAAIQQYQQVLQKEPESLVAQLQLAHTYVLAKEHDRAIDAYRRALRLQPYSEEALNNLAYLYAQLGRNLDEALRLAQKADKHMPNQPRRLDTLGFILYQRKEYDKALRYLKRAKELSGESPTATRLYHLALVYHKKGMKQEAVTELSEALRCHPSSEEIQDVQRLLEELNKVG